MNTEQQQSNSEQSISIDFAEVLEQLNSIRAQPARTVGVPLQPIQSDPQPNQPPLIGQFAGRNTPTLDQPLHQLIISTVQMIIPDLAAFDLFKNVSEEEAQKKFDAVQSIAGKVGVLAAKIADELSEQFESKKLIQTPNGVYYRV